MTDAAAAINLAWTLSTEGRHEAAEPAWRRAAELDPRNAAVWGNLGATLAKLQRADEAEGCFRKVLEIDPGDIPALRNLTVILRGQGRLDDARELFAAARGRGLPADLVAPAELALRVVNRSRAEIAEERAAYAEGLRNLRALPGPLVYDGEPFGLQAFYLAYHALDDRPLMEETASTFRAKIAGLDHASPNATAPRGDGRIRVAFVSDNLNNHTIGHLYRGIVRHLDRARFEVAVVHGAYSRRDAFRDSVDAAADEAVVLRPGLAAQRAQIAALRPDIVFYPDIGMSAPSYFLAHSRLAPVQATAWGHPDTTGLSSLDYFISTELFEPAGGAAHYTEQLATIPRIPCCFDPPEPPPAVSREAAGLPATGTLYGCPQTLFKLHPDFDAVLAAIAQGDPEGHIVLPAADQPGWTAAVEARWRETFPILLERVRWTPRIEPEAFLAQLAHFDVLLDPLHFGSGYTFYLAMTHGVPMVTWPGEFARGRVVAGAYRQMGVGQELVAASPADYAGLALKLGRDPGRRAKLRTELHRAARDHLFSDLAAVEQLGDLFAAAVEAARRGERLAPAGPGCG
ncbi:tetratricopeptide repeat protein [Phenylobacterium sp.]|uniref:O-linked N-acetylglucosamine transferase, SPINDLY family protein n=1 Tax=Phenylobacterium sp. TaxID=1871053 RepID=UPI0035635AD3